LIHFLTNSTMFQVFEKALLFNCHHNLISEIKDE